MLFGYIMHWLPGSFKAWYRDWFIKTPMYAKVGIVTGIVFVIYQSWSAALQPFIYFQF
jgi:hypothetical protein